MERTKLPKGYKWTDEAVITKIDNNLNNKKVQFYPIGNDLYIKGFYIIYNKTTGKKSIPVTVIPKYKDYTASQFNRKFDVPIIMQNMICQVWRELGLPLGFVISQFA